MQHHSKTLPFHKVNNFYLALFILAIPLLVTIPRRAVNEPSRLFAQFINQIGQTRRFNAWNIEDALRANHTQNLCRSETTREFNGYTDKNGYTYPAFIMIGSPKCGTGVMKKYLEEHPEIIGTKVEEVHYFDNFDPNPYNRYFARNIKIRTFEKSMGYMEAYSPAWRIKEFYKSRNLAEPKLVALLCDPAKRAYSAWSMCKRKYSKYKQKILSGQQNNFGEMIRKHINCIDSIITKLPVYITELDPQAPADTMHEAMQSRWNIILNRTGGLMLGENATSYVDQGADCMRIPRGNRSQLEDDVDAKILAGEMATRYHKLAKTIGPKAMFDVWERKVEGRYSPEHQRIESSLEADAIRYYRANTLAQYISEINIIPRLHKLIALGQLTNGLYSVWLNRWFKLFCPSNILLLNGDNMLKDPYSTMKRLETFLGVSDFYKPEQFQFVEEVGFFCYFRDGKSQCVAGASKSNGLDVKGSTRSGKTGEITAGGFLNVSSELKEFFRPFNRDLTRLAKHYKQEFTHDWPV